MVTARVEALLKRLRKGAARGDRAFCTLSDDEWSRVADPGPPSWTVRDVAAHLLSAEDGLRRLAQDVASGALGAPSGLDHDELNAAEQARLAAIPVSELLADLAASREATISWVATLTDRDLDQVGQHPALGEITLETHINAIYGHVLMHLRDLQHGRRAPG